MKKFLKFSVLILFLVMLSLAAFQWELVNYALAQARGQLEIVWNAKPIAVYLEDPDFPSELKYKLELITEIRQFAFDSLAINHSDNYTTMYDQGDKELMWVVTASEPFLLEPYEWKFPFIGTFSYKGFFDYEKAEKLEKELKKMGLDTDIRTAGGWSTLGWFKDPVLSKMLDRSEGALAELIIHELTHGTLFVKDSLQFNENLATFIGTKGAEWFLKMKYGEDSGEYENYIISKSDQKYFSNHILRGAQHLDSLYQGIISLTDSVKKLQMKNQALDLIVDNVDTLSLVNKERYLRYINNLKPNNTFFMSYLRYRGELELLENEFAEKYRGNILLMLSDYKKKYPSL
jgi:predicted aminopeptidase